MIVFLLVVIILSILFPTFIKFLLGLLLVGVIVIIIGMGNANSNTHEEIQQNFMT
jgi:hypothetical protein